MIKGGFRAAFYFWSRPHPGCSISSVKLLCKLVPLYWGGGMKTTTAIIVTAFCLHAASNAQAADMPAVAKKYECDGCHGIDNGSVGPAWMAVSKKYKGITRYSYGGREYALEDGLVMKVSHGGSGNWGKMPMPANDPHLQHQPDMRMLVRFILRLEK